jgi:hypothetical protein
VEGSGRDPFKLNKFSAFYELKYLLTCSLQPATELCSEAGKCKMTVFWVLIALMMDAASTSETSVNFYKTTRHNIPEDSHLHTHRRENLNSHQVNALHNLRPSFFKIHFIVTIYAWNSQVSLSYSFSD